MKKIVIILSVLAFVASSCRQTTKKQTGTANEIIANQNNKRVENTIEENNDRKIEVNYNSNKELLDIILLLPDSAFSTWEWKIEKRKEWYNEIKSNNFWIDKDTMFFKQIYFKPNTACFQIGDGAWTISLYKASDNSSIVITDDIEGDGNTINIFEVKDNKIIKNMNFESLFGDYREQIKLNNFSQDCNEKSIEFEDAIFSFDFSGENTAEIESSWYLTKEEYKNCLKGNAILYKFNSKTKKFEIDKIYWKSKQEN